MTTPPMSKNDDLVRTAQTSVRDHIRTIAARLMEGDRRLTIVHPLPSIGTSYYPPEIAKEVGELLFDAIERGAAQGVWVKPLEWKRNNATRDATIWAETSFGDFRIEQKRGDDRCLWSAPVGDWIEALSTADAKAAAQADYERRIMSALDLSTPPAPAPDAGEDHMVPCAQCGKPVDTREVEEGGDPHGSEMTCDGVWVCSISCYAAFDPSKPSPTPQPPVVEAEAGTRAYIRDWTPDAVQDHVGSLEVALKAKTDEIERLTRINRGLHDEVQFMRNAAKEHRIAREAAEASNKALREGLEPFAAIADLIDSETEGFSDTDEFELMFGDHLFERFKLSTFRRARAALRALRGEGGVDG